LFLFALCGDARIENPNLAIFSDGILSGYIVVATPLKAIGVASNLIPLANIGRLRLQGRSVRQIASELGYSRGIVHKTLASSKSLAVASAAG